MTHQSITIDGIEYDLVPKAGSEMKLVHAGYDPVTGEAFQCADRDIEKKMKWVDAKKWVETLGGSWRLPTIAELQVMYNNKEKIGDFKTSGSGDNANWYWSCTEHPDFPSGVWSVRFSDGLLNWDGKDNCALSVRPVFLEL